MKVQFIASFAAITPDPASSRRLYDASLGLPLEHSDGDDYEHSEEIAGTKHFGVWPLRQSPGDRPSPDCSQSRADHRRLLHPLDALTPWDALT
jgi:hypothetical protein